MLCLIVLWGFSLVTSYSGVKGKRTATYCFVLTYTRSSESATVLYMWGWLQYLQWYNDQLSNGSFQTVSFETGRLEMARAFLPRHLQHALYQAAEAAMTCPCIPQLHVNSSISTPSSHVQMLYVHTGVVW